MPPGGAGRIRAADRHRLLGSRHPSRTRPAPGAGAARPRGPGPCPWRSGAAAWPRLRDDPRLLHVRVQQRPGGAVRRPGARTHPAAIGLAMGIGASGSLVGALAAPWLSRRIGVGRSIAARQPQLPADRGGPGGPAQPRGGRIQHRQLRRTPPRSRRRRDARHGHRSQGDPGHGRRRRDAVAAVAAAVAEIGRTERRSDRNGGEGSGRPCSPSHHVRHAQAGRVSDSCPRCRRFPPRNRTIARYVNEMRFWRTTGEGAVP